MYLALGVFLKFSVPYKTTVNFTYHPLALVLMIENIKISTQLVYRLFFTFFGTDRMTLISQTCGSIDPEEEFVTLKYV